MGYYVNPNGTSKEDWLKQNAMPLLNPPQNFSDVPEDMVLLCWVFNLSMGFTALAIITTEREFTRWLPDDGRPKIFFLTSRKDLEKPEAGADPGWNS